MKILKKLQLKTLLPVQLLGYSFALFVGLTILSTAFNLYKDISPIFKTETNFFQKNTIAISKKVTIFKTLNKHKIYFSEKEISNLRNQKFVEKVDFFQHATYKIKAKTSINSSVPGLQTDLFFESIPSNLIDVKTAQFVWKENDNFIPIIIPESYIKLYNFGFAESQGLPVISKNAIKEISFNVAIFGNGKSENFKAKIVGFSNQINSVLVPNTFLEWSNKIYGNTSQTKINRLLITTTGNEKNELLAFFKDKNYDINKKDLQNDKTLNILNFVFLVIFIVALIIVILSLAFIYLSINLVMVKNQKLIQNLYSIGYSQKNISKFYLLSTSIVSLLSIIVALISSHFIRNTYLDKLNQYFTIEVNANYSILTALIIFILLFLFFKVYILTKINKIVDDI